MAKTDADPVDEPVVAEAATPLFKPAGPKRTFATLTCPACGKVQPSKETDVQKLDWTCFNCGAAYYTMLRIDSTGYLLTEGS